MFQPCVRIIQEPAPLGTQRMQAQTSSCRCETSLSRETKLQSCQQPGLLESSEREAPIRTPGALLERWPVTWGDGRQEAPDWKQSFDDVGKQVQVMLRGIRSLRSWGCKCWWSWRHRGNPLLGYCHKRLTFEGDILHCPHIRITLSRKNYVYSLKKKLDYCSVFPLSDCDPHA